MKITGPTHLYHPDYDGYKEIKTQAEYDRLIDEDDRWADTPYPDEAVEEVSEVPKGVEPTLVPKDPSKVKPRSAAKKGKK